jgi:cell division septal protein FtsQ
MIRKPSTQNKYNLRATAREQYRRENDIILQRMTWLLAFLLLVTLCLGAGWLWLIA